MAALCLKVSLQQALGQKYLFGIGNDTQPNAHAKQLGCRQQSHLFVRVRFDMRMRSGAKRTRHIKRGRRSHLMRLTPSKGQSHVAQVLALYCAAQLLHMLAAVL